MLTLIRNIFISVAALSLGSATFAQSTHDFSSHPIKIVVPYGAAGGPDVLARLVAQQMSAALKTSVVVENKPGANGSLAAQLVASSQKDGHTLLLADSGHMAINPALYAKLAYNPSTDFTPLTLLASAPLFVIINPSKHNFSNFKEFIEYAKKYPGKLSYGSSGNGSPHHLAMEWLKKDQGLEIEHIPFKGVADSVPALLGGQIDVMFAALPSVDASIKAGKLKNLAVSAPARTSLSPEIPTLQELGIANFDVVSRIGVFAPQGVKSETLQSLERNLLALMNTPEISNRLPNIGLVSEVLPSADFQKNLQQEQDKYKNLVTLTNLKVD